MVVLEWSRIKQQQQQQQLQQQNATKSVLWFSWFNNQFTIYGLRRHNIEKLSEEKI